MPATLTNLYAGPQDVFDYLGAEATQIRLDDSLRATGQTITVTTAAALGATSLAVQPLLYPLLAGSVLEFDGGGNPAIIEVRTSSVARVGDTSISVTPLSAAVPALCSARDSGVDLALADRLLKGCRYGTGQVQLYCLARYDDTELVKSWSVSRWASMLAGRWVCRRCSRPAPKSVEADCKEALEEMRQVQLGMLQLDNAGTRTSGWPFVTNVTVDMRYTYRKVRVESSISEATPTQYPQAIDWGSVFLLEL